MQTNHKGKISYALQAISVIPLLLCGIAIALLGSHWFTKAMHEEVFVGLKNVALNTISWLDTAYPGDYCLTGETAYEIYKGEHNLTKDYALIDRIKADTGLDITLFYQDTRILTTISGSNGSRFIGTGAAPTIIADVLETGEAHFYENILINGSPYFAYYAPLFNADGSVTGMLFVGKARESVDEAIQKSIYPLLLFTLAALLMVVTFLSLYTRKLVSVLLKLRSFLSQIAAGDLDTKPDPSVTKRNDELGDIGRSALAMQRSLRKMLERDALTGLYNRGFGDKKLTKLFSDSIEHNTPFCVCIADIDHFKSINDTYGHQCGDRVLKNVADLLKKYMHSKGFVARWGGEEFLLVFENTDTDSAYEILETLREAIQALDTKHEGETVKVSMTFGLTDNQAENVTQLLNKADEKLYRGKSAGRNCIIT